MWLIAAILVKRSIYPDLMGLVDRYGLEIRKTGKSVHWLHISAMGEGETLCLFLEQVKGNFGKRVAYSVRKANRPRPVNPAPAPAPAPVNPGPYYRFGNRFLSNPDNVNYPFEEN